jgi:UDP-N-acetyl-2-amino-2-deoxyglucuronate dehydrogenase
MSKELSIAVLGLGMGMHHCEAIKRAKGVALAAVCDHDEERLSTAVKKYDVKGYLRFKDLVRDKGIEAVSVCTESGTHAKFGIRLAEAGKHIVMEKPVEIRSDRIDDFRKAVKKLNVKCACVFQSRLDPLNAAIKNALDAGHMGKTIGAHACLPWFRADDYYAGPHGSWKGTWKLDGGGSLMNQGIHTVDLLQWFAGPVKSVFGFHGVFNHKIEAEDQAVAVLRFKSGALGTLFTTTCSSPEGAQRFHLYGTKGSFIKTGDTLELYEMGPQKVRDKMLSMHGGPIQRADTAGKDPMAIATAGHTIIFEDLANAVREKRDPIVTIENARHSVEIVLGIYKACRTKKEVLL